MATGKRGLRELQKQPRRWADPGIPDVMMFERRLAVCRRIRGLTDSFLINSMCENVCSEGRIRQTITVKLPAELAARGGRICVGRIKIALAGANADSVRAGARWKPRRRPLLRACHLAITGAHAGQTLPSDKFTMKRFLVRRHCGRHMLRQWHIKNIRPSLAVAVDETLLTTIWGEWTSPERGLDAMGVLAA